MADQLTAFQSKYTAQEIESFFDDINNGEFVPAGGGCGGNGARYGLASSDLDNGAGVSYWNCGASISCLPNLEKQQNDAIIKQWTKDYNNLI